MMMNKRLRVNIFVDFDGTITLRDVGDAMFERFGGIRSTEAIDRYRRGELSAVECFRTECDACGTVDKRALDAFIDAQQVDPTFADFLAFCDANGFQCWVLSDGMDHYIDRILDRRGFRVRRFSNALEFVPAGEASHVTLRPSFPFTDEVCDRCACCKRNHMLTLSGDDDLIVYVGEGYSDRCPARHADIIFAKDELLRYCRSEKIPCREYGTFGDIVRHLQKLSAAPGGSRGFRKRRQAELARRAVFSGG